ncbi:MAG: VWA domain-containing protein [Sulfurovum sp.]|nr:VWA domain-containing protein [Sulfurovum sp.]
MTYDLDGLSYLLDLTNVGIAGESTAIGDAIIQAIDTLSYGEAQSKVMVLLSDGYHNAGRNSPKFAVSQAKAKGIKIYTIGIGKSSDYDVTLLETIAKQTDAKSYPASSSEALAEVYAEIHALEPSAIRSENYLSQGVLIVLPLSLVFFLLLGWILWDRRGL